MQRGHTILHIDVISIGLTWQPPVPQNSHNIPIPSRSRNSRYRIRLLDNILLSNLLTKAGGLPCAQTPIFKLFYEVYYISGLSLRVEHLGGPWPRKGGEGVELPCPLGR